MLHENLYLKYKYILTDGFEMYFVFNQRYICEVNGVGGCCPHPIIISVDFSPPFVLHFALCVLHYEVIVSRETSDFVEGVFDILTTYS